MVRCAFCGHDSPAGSHACEHCGAVLPTPLAAPAPTHQLDAELRMLLDQGRKIEAIKRYRELTGAGLKEARDVVEAIDRGQATGFPTAANVDDRFRRELIELLRKGRKIEAIKAYRARTGAGLKEAKDAVEALDPRPPGERGGGCLAGLLLLGLIAAGGAGWIALMF